MVTKRALEKFETTYKEMDSAKKWKLADGAFVEDIIHNYVKDRTYEIALRSFIVDPSDPIWADILPRGFPPDNLLADNPVVLPALDQHILDYAESFKDKVDFHL